MVFDHEISIDRNDILARLHPLYVRATVIPMYLVKDHTADGVARRGASRSQILNPE